MGVDVVEGRRLDGLDQVVLQVDVLTVDTVKRARLNRRDSITAQIAVNTTQVSLNYRCHLITGITKLQVPFNDRCQLSMLKLFRVSNHEKSRNSSTSAGLNEVTSTCKHTNMLTATLRSLKASLVTRVRRLFWR